MLEVTTQLNTPGIALAEMEEVHAMTDVTGFGLAGHLLEICRGSKLGAEIRFDDLPVLPEALEWVKQGTATGASDRNWKGIRMANGEAIPISVIGTISKISTDANDPPRIPICNASNAAAATRRTGPAIKGTIPSENPPHAITMNMVLG